MTKSQAAAKNDRLRVAVIVPVALSLLLPLVAYGYIGTFTRYFADDYCHGARVQSTGWIEAQKNWFMSWSGRFASNFVMATALALGPVSAICLPALTLTLWVAGLAWGIAQLRLTTQTRVRWTAAWGLAVLLVFATVTGLPNIPQVFFWLVSIVAHPAPLLAVGPCVGLFSLIGRSEPSRRRWPLWLLACGSITFVAGGFSEVYAILQIGALGLALLGSFGLQPAARKRRVFLALLTGLLGALLALLVMWFAPGTSVRHATYHSSPGILYTLWNARQYANWFVRDVVARAPLSFAISFGFAMLLALWLTPETPPVRSGARAIVGGILWPPVIGYLLLVCCYVPIFYIMQGPPPDRLLVTPQFVFVAAAAGWGYGVGQGLRYLTQHLVQWGWRLAFWVLLAPVGLLIFYPLATAWFTLAAYPSVRSYALTWDSFDRDIRNARARGAARFEMPIIGNINGLDNFSSDPNYWVNRCAFDYYGLQIVGYSPPLLPNAAEIKSEVKLDATIGDVAKVLGYRLDRTVAQSGQTLAVTILWLPLRHTERPYTVFIHLYDPAVGLIAQTDSYPKQGYWDYPTTLWVHERPFVDTYTLSVPDRVPSASNARLVVGLYNLDDMKRLPVTGADAASVDEPAVALRSIQVLP